MNESMLKRGSSNADDVNFWKVLPSLLPHIQERGGQAASAAGGGASNTSHCILAQALSHLSAHPFHFHTANNTANNTAEFFARALSF